MANLVHYRTGEVIRVATAAERLRAARDPQGIVIAEHGVMCRVDGREGPLGIAVAELGSRLEHGKPVGAEWLVGRYVRGMRHQTLARFGEREADACAFEARFNAEGELPACG